MTLSGTSNLPIAPRSTPWDPIGAKRRVLDACGGNVACISRGFLWRSDGDPRTPEVWSLGFCDVIDGRLHIIPKGLAACSGARGIGTFSGADEDALALQARITAIYDRVRREVEDWPVSPFAAITADASGPGISGPIAFEGVETGDKRFIEDGALTWDEGPWPLVFDRTDMDHSGATVGTINTIERREGGVIWATGNLSDSEDPETVLLALRAGELFAEGAVGVSVSLDDQKDNTPDNPEEEFPEVHKVISARIRSVAIVDEAAFSEAKLALVADVGLVAAAFRPTLKEAFINPGFGNGSKDPRDANGDPRLVWQEPERPEEEPQFGCPLTINEDGSYYGHLALWYRCHVGYAGTCVRPPREPAAYRGYLTGERVPGIPSGPMIMKTGHPSLKLSANDAKIHYDHTGYAPGDNIIGPDTYGIWAAGQLRPDVTEAEIEALRGSALSGDWREDGGRVRLIGVLAVSGPGFRVSRALAASGAFITMGPGCEPCQDERPLEDRVADLERLLADSLLGVEAV